MIYDVDKIKVINIDRESAKNCVMNNHYMKTFPAGAKIYLGILHEGFPGLKGVAVFGMSSSTLKKISLFPAGFKEENIIEMQRLWVSDDLGKNAESKILSLIMDLFKQKLKQIKVVWTYAGGCKNDCGIVYQSSGFQYLGSEPCNDFYLTESGEYRNIISALRFGKAPKGMKDKKDIANHLWGKGAFIEANRYYYFYAIDKSIRRKMLEKTKPFPKVSARYRLNQQWVEDSNGAGEGDSAVQK